MNCYISSLKYSCFKRYVSGYTMLRNSAIESSLNSSILNCIFWGANFCEVGGKTQHIRRILHNEHNFFRSRS